jgi:hypothetical protein
VKLMFMYLDFFMFLYNCNTIMLSGKHGCFSSFNKCVGILVCLLC